MAALPQQGPTKYAESSRLAAEFPFTEAESPQIGVESSADAGQFSLGLAQSACRHLQITAIPDSPLQVILPDFSK